MFRHIDKASKMYNNVNNENDDDDGRSIVERKCKSHFIQSNDIFVIILSI